MAYFNQERKAAIAPVVKAICKKYNIKASLAVRHHSTVVLNIKSGAIDFIGNYNERTTNTTAHAKTYIDVNPYWFNDHFTGVAKEFLQEVFVVLNTGNWDNSDIQTDYFDKGWYVDVNVGRWDKPYVLEA